MVLYKFQSSSALEMHIMLFVIYPNTPETKFWNKYRYVLSYGAYNEAIEEKEKVGGCQYLYVLLLCPTTLSLNCCIEFLPARPSPQWNKKEHQEEAFQTLRTVQVRYLTVL
jgi:hypothetical protein